MENDSKTMSADNWGQIIRKDARGCFVEIKNDCFHLEKVHLQFVSYDTSLPKGSRYTSNINIYIDVPEFLALTQEAASGTLHMRMQQYKQEKKQEPLYEHLGGTSAKTAGQVRQISVRREEPVPGRKTDDLKQVRLLSHCG